MAAGTAVALGSLLQGSVGFGLGLLASPILVFIDPRLVPAPLLFNSLILTLLLTHRERRSVDFHGLTWALSGRVFGVAAGAAALVIVAENRIGLLFGMLVLVSVAISASGLHFQPTRWMLAGAGALSGFMGTTISIGGPPMALVYQHAPGARIRGTLSGYFTVGVAMSLVALHLVGRFGRPEILTAAALLPGTLVGYALSARTAGILDGGHMRRAVLAVSAVTGLVVIIRQVI